MKKLSVIIPVYNEGDTIKTLVNKVKAVKIRGMSKEIIVIDDHSNDSTAKELEGIKGIKSFRLRKNRGKGAAIRKGFKEANGDIILMQDADLEYDPNEYSILLEPILTGHADVVYGSRFLNDKPHRVLYYWHSVANSFLTLISNALTNLNLTDMETGSKVFTNDIIKQLLPNLKSNRFGIEPEITARVARLARRGECRMYEVGISYYGRTYEEGKKINWKDGVKAFWYIILYNLLEK